MLSTRHQCLPQSGALGKTSCVRRCSLPDTSQTTHCQIITTTTTTTRRSQQPPPQINVSGQEHQADGEVPQLHHRGHTHGNGHAPAPSVRALHEKHAQWWDQAQKSPLPSDRPRASPSTRIHGSWESAIGTRRSALWKSSLKNVQQIRSYQKRKYPIPFCLSGCCVLFAHACRVFRKTVVFHTATAAANLRACALAGVSAIE